MMPYRKTKEDDLLLKPYRIYNGVKMDIRWSGGWLTPEGVYYPVDYINGITHATIAQEHGIKIREFSGSIMTRPPMMRIFDIAKWIRIIYFEGSSFCVELKGNLVDMMSHYIKERGDYVDCYDCRRQNVLLKFINEYRDGFGSYFINDVEFKCYREFIMAIKEDNVLPTGFHAPDTVDSVNQDQRARFFDAANNVDVEADSEYDIPVFLRDKI